MTDKPEQNVQALQEEVQVQPEKKVGEMSNWGEAIVRIVQHLLEYNLITYTKEKSSRL